MDELNKAIEHYSTKAGLARALGVDPMTVHQWIKRGYVPVEQAAALDRISNGAFRADRIRPDVKWIRRRGRLVAYTIALAA